MLDFRQPAMEALWHAACFSLQVVQFLTWFMESLERPAVNQRETGRNDVRGVQAHVIETMVRRGFVG